MKCNQTNEEAFRIAYAKKQARKAEAFPCSHPRTPQNTLTDAGKARCRTCRNKTFREAKQRARKREKAILEVFPEVVEALEILLGVRGQGMSFSERMAKTKKALAKARAATANG